MRQTLLLSMLLLGGFALLNGQVYDVEVTDTVTLPTYNDPLLFDDIIFREVWTIHPSKAGLHKEVLEIRVMDEDRLVKPWPRDQYQGKIAYEFLLKDPLTGATGDLQAPLAELVERHAPAARQYDMKEQLISVRFSEKWSYDTLSTEFSKTVNWLTPVIWQRRQTAEGEPVDDPETGLPVYYKLELDRIAIRNP